jgi:type I restriction enzyme S subunit
MKKLFTEGLYGEPQKETEIGMVPESWELRRLGSVAKFQGGYAFKSGSYVNKGVRLLRISNVSFGHADWTDTAFLPESMLQEYEDYSLKTDDIVMAMTRPVVSGGIKVATLQSTDVPALLNQRVGRFRCSREVVDRFLYQLVFTDNFVASINTYADGSQQPNISAGQIESIMIPLPRSTDEQIEIAKRLDLIDADLEIHSNKRRLLQDLFQSALSMLMSGKGVISNLKVETPCLDSQEFAA